jgi:putative ABC transport system ATP-binding protein
MILFKNIRLTAHLQSLLDNATLRISQQDKVVVRGVSGSGKSSLLKCAVGLFPIQAGTVDIDGLELSSITASAIRRRIAYIGQEPILGASTVQDALFLPFTFKAHRDRKPAAQTVTELLERLRLPESILQQPCERISGGEKQRIAIARALLLNKNVFLADEVTSALDPQSRKAVILELFRPEITLLSVSHDPEWIRACDRTVEIRNHQLQEELPASNNGGEPS